MSNVNKETVSVLSRIIGEQISKKQAVKNYAETSPSVREKLVSLLNDMQGVVDIKIFDAAATLTSYKKNKVTNYELSGMIVDALVVKLSSTLTPLYNFESGLSLNDSVTMKGLVSSIIADTAEDVVKLNGVSFESEDVLESLARALESHADPDTKFIYGDITSNEFVYGSRIERGNGYDHLLDWNVSKVLNHMRVSGRMEALGLVNI